MTPLAERIVHRITATGPIDLADFMADCLMHPEHGYYATRDPFGSTGDFTTAPEISQMFGELVGLALAHAWRDQGAPKRIVLAEAGPGRGTLMRDLLRATRGVPGFHAALELWLIEASQMLRGYQAATLAGAGIIHWTGHVGGLPDAPLFLIANEFLDALPIRQFCRHGSGWRERHVKIACGSLALGWGAPQTVPVIAYRLHDTQNGDIVEFRPALPAIMGGIGTRIANRGGAALIIDYGGWRSLGDTLQALKDHRPDDPLAHPGEADLTAHVDFEAIARAAGGCRVSPVTGQGVFLSRLGIGTRAGVLEKHLTGAALQSHQAGLRRLTAKNGMGSLFKVIGLSPINAPALPGLAG